MYKPDTVSPPGVTLGDVLQERKMKVTQLADATGIPASLILELIEGKVPLTPQIADDLEKVFGISADFWNTREKLYRESLKESKDD